MGETTVFVAAEKSRFARMAFVSRWGLRGRALMSIYTS